MYIAACCAGTCAYTLGPPVAEALEKEVKEEHKRQAERAAWAMQKVQEALEAQEAKSGRG